VVGVKSYACGLTGAGLRRQREDERRAAFAASHGAAERLRLEAA